MTRKAKAGAAGLGVLLAMQVFGQLVLWDGLWRQGPTDQEMWAIAALWWAWTAIQIAFGVVVGITMYRGVMESVRAHRARVQGEISGAADGTSERDPGTSRGRGLAAA